MRWRAANSSGKDGVLIRARSGAPLCSQSKASATTSVPSARPSRRTICVAIFCRTRAGRGIGRALAAYFAGKAANLALLDTNESDLQETAALCTLEGVKAHCYVANAADEIEVVKTLDTRSASGLWPPGLSERR